MAVPGCKYLLLFVSVFVSCSIDMWQVLIGSYQELYLLYDTEFVSLCVFIIYFNDLVFDEDIHSPMSPDQLIVVGVGILSVHHFTRMIKDIHVWILVDITSLVHHS